MCLGIREKSGIFVGMKTLALGVVLVGLLVGCGEKSAPPTTAKKVDIQNNSSGNPVTAPVDYLGAVAKAKKTSVSVADKASLKQAIDMFKQEEDRYPKDLNELVAKQYMPALPAPPYQMKYQYDPATGDVKVVPAQ
jgi:hypothetical protein